MSGNTILLNDPTRNWAFTTNYINGTYGNGIIIDASGSINSNLVTFRTNGNVRATISDASFSVQNNLVVSGNTSLQSLRSTSRIVTGNLITSNINVSLANPIRPDVSYNYSVINLANTFTDLSNNYSGNAYTGQIGYLLSTNSLYAYQGFAPTGSWTQLYNYVPQKMLVTYTGNSLTGTYFDPSGSGINYRWVAWTNTTTPTYGSVGGTSVTPSAITITQLSNIPGYNNIDFLIVGGGGGGGCGWQGGGGGGGGVISSTASLGISGGYGLNPGPFTATSLASYNVGVGGGGPGARYSTPAYRSYNGGSSYITFPGYTSYTSPIQNSVGSYVQSQTFLVPTEYTWPPVPCSNYSVPTNATALTAFGGGGGSSELDTASPALTGGLSAQQPGGCGGGGSHGGSVPYENGVSPYPYQTYTQGFGGGNGFSGYQTSPSVGYVGPFIGGGGGGAGTPGMTASATSTSAGTGGNGGSGLVNIITGSLTTFAGGGGGACRANITTPVAGSGGSGGGGNGGSVSGATTSGSPATGYGSGGGGGSSNVGGGAGQVGGNGSGGIVIIRWII
jgi:hypothetical protein